MKKNSLFISPNYIPSSNGGLSRLKQLKQYEQFNYKRIFTTVPAAFCTS
jgi:hypothetical protein